MIAEVVKVARNTTNVKSEVSIEENNEFHVFAISALTECQSFAGQHVPGTVLVMDICM
jgi:hypothetical protein